MKVQCPRCKKYTIYSKDNFYRPFCSERCRLIDLGHWLDGEYSIKMENSGEDNQPEEEETKQ
jgi:endogenous inhibitor of DNA gyrase (YacG/DUF329 family)